MKKNVLTAFILFVSISYSTIAQHAPAVETSRKPGWHKIAEMVVNLKNDRDEVLVLGMDHFKSIRLKVTDHAIEIVDLMVVYENETHQDIPVSRILKAGERTRVMDLVGRDRAIKKVILKYRTLPNAKDERAHVEIWGRK